MNVDRVVDNSALIEFFTGSSPTPQLKRLMLGSRLGAPELIDTESLQTLRKLARQGALSSDEAEQTLTDVMAAPISRASHRPLMPRAWQLRHSISGYDAFYVALAEELGVPLITCDSKLAGSNGHRADIELYPTS